MPRRKQAYLSDVLGLRNFQRCWGSSSNFRDNRYTKIHESLEKYLRPSVSRYFGDHAITIQHDTTPCHASMLIRKYLEENDIFMMEWPA